MDMIYRNQINITQSGEVGGYLIFSLLFDKMSCISCSLIFECMNRWEIICTPNVLLRNEHCQPPSDTATDET